MLKQTISFNFFDLFLTNNMHFLKSSISVVNVLE